MHVPSLLGCISEGETVDEAMKNGREAIELYTDQADEQPSADPPKS